MNKLSILPIAIAGLGIMTMSAPVHAVVEFDQNVTPAPGGLIVGTGIGNGGFTTDRANGIELGLRGNLRFDANCEPQNTFNSLGDGRYVFAPGNKRNDPACVAKIGNLGFPTWFTEKTVVPEWSFAFSVNSDLAANSIPLSTYDYRMGWDTDPLAGTAYFPAPLLAPYYDPINGDPFGGCADHALGNNATPADGGTSVSCSTEQSTYQQLLTLNNAAQNAWNYAFWEGFFPFDATQPGEYTIFLEAYLKGQAFVAPPLARTEITIIVNLGVAFDDTATLIEDDDATLINVLSNDATSGAPLVIDSVTQPTNGTVAICTAADIPTAGCTGAGTELTYRPDADYCNDGTPTDDFTYTLNGGSTATVAVTVTCLNDRPTFDVIAPINVDEDNNGDGTNTNVPVAENFNPGPANESTQTLARCQTKDTWIEDLDSILVPGSLSVQKNAGLTGCEVDFTTKPNQFGSFRFRVRVKDSGSNAGSNKAWSLRKWVTITVNPVNDPPYVESVTAETQTVQYSDDIDQVTILVRDIDSPFGDLSLAKSGEPTDLDSASLVQTTLCGEWDSEFTGKGSECTWTLDGQVTVPGDKDYIITFDPDDGDALTAGVTGTHTLTVVPEEAAVYLDNEGTANPVSAPVVEGGDKNQEFTMFFWAFEMNTVPFFDEADEGNANSVDSDFVDPNVKGYISFKAVGPGDSPPRIPCTSSEDVEGDGQYGDYMVFECIIPEGTLEVNTYEVLAEVDGEEACTDSDPCRYFYGFDEDAFVVYDPDAGFTTGGGWFYFPDTEVAADACLEYECAEFNTTECLVYNEVCLVDDPCADYPGDKTNFGFTMKYNKKGTNVQGSALVMRHTKVPVEIETGVWACLEDGNYRVKSNVLYGLALSESEEPPFGYASFAGKATYREPDFDYGGNHTFFIYVEDYGDQGCNQGEEANDRFWIELWDKDDNVVLMPTMGDDAAVEAEAIECGNIVVPFESGGGGGGHGKGKNK